ncbi:MAG: Rrf2 family transcriptional regulator [Candidatus Omnitrophota bacterium]|nr:Rrf2 family transcriptional regulator [Candidatus Omnitrophota bacterium]
MKLITRDTDYAMRALMFMAKQKETMTSVSELAKELKIPRPFLRKILQVLNKKRILKSHKGQSGGFLLATPPNRIFLVDLIEILQGPLKLNTCLLKKTTCPDVTTCVLKKRIERIEAYVILQLKSINVTSLLN